MSKVFASLELRMAMRLRFHNHCASRSCENRKEPLSLILSPLRSERGYACTGLRCYGASDFKCVVKAVWKASEIRIPKTREYERVEPERLRRDYDYDEDRQP